MTRALVLGVNGQDGILLSQLLLERGFTVFGVGFQSLPSIHLRSEVNYQSIDIRETEKISKLISESKIERVYNLAGLSSVAESFLNPVEFMEINYLAVKGLLEEIFSDSRNEALRFYQASSSEMFGLALENPQSETTAFNPVSPYAESKVKAHIESENFRKSGFFVSCGILFNHESTFRPERFISRKISSSVARISLGLQSQLVVGNIEARRDWGAAKDYVDAMNRILEHSKPDVYVVATGKLHSVKEMITLALQRVGLHERFDELVSFDENLLRPTEAMEICGNPSKIQSELGWSAKTDLKTLIHEMVDYDLAAIQGAS